MNRCPHCDQEILPDIVADLGIMPSPQEQFLLDIIKRAGPVGALVKDVVYEFSGRVMVGKTPAEMRTHQIKHRLNKRLQPHGWTIQGGYGVGARYLLTRAYQG